MSIHIISRGFNFRFFDFLGEVGWKKYPPIIGKEIVPKSLLETARVDGLDTAFDAVYAYLGGR